MNNQTPGVILQFINQYNGGNGQMDQRNIIGSFNNSDLKGNNAIQSDDVTQTQSVNTGEADKAFKDLFEEIKKISDDAQRAQAEYNAEELRAAVESEDKSKAQKLIGFLKSSIGTVASLATIARFLGLTL